MIKTNCFIFSMIAMLSFNYGQNRIIPLWEKGVPNYQETKEQEVREEGDILWVKLVQKPSIEVFLPTKQSANGQAMIICPGGGYYGLAYDWEGTDIAKFLNAQGIAAFVLKYRLPISKSITTPHETPLMDAQRALRIVRYNAKEWNIDPNQIGIMGFSAGGHLASTLGTQFDRYFEPKDSIDKESARPDFMALVYPVITMRERHTHKGSKFALLGKNPDEALSLQYSNELQVTKDTPPTFLVHSTDDEGVPVENSLLFYQALKDNKVPVEMHIYPYGEHGYSLAIGQGHLQGWINRLAEWLQSLKN